MPSYPHLLTDDIPWATIQTRVDAMAMLGVPYDAQALDHAGDLAKHQAEHFAAELADRGRSRRWPTRRSSR